MVYNSIKHVSKCFRFEGEYLRAEEILSGNVNNTYRLTYSSADGGRQYILQQINGYAFRHPEAIMRNIEQVTGHLRRKMLESGISPERRILNFIPVADGTMLHRDEYGNAWRAYRYIDRAFAYDRVEKPEHFFEAGRAFGEFQRLLSDFPAERLSHTIPNFHNTPRRFFDFVRAVSEDRAGRVRLLEREIDFFFDRRKMMGEIMRAVDAGELPVRATHNDTKINNVLIDQESEQAICVIDLDTVMPGSVLFDYGDAVRYGASRADEDEEDLSKIELDMELFSRFTEGFIGQVNGFLTRRELELLPLGIRVITCELAMRFLTDYIDGDLYFKVKSPEHNLVRARAQMRLLEDVERKYDEILRTVRGML